MQADGLHRACQGSTGGGSGGDSPLCLPPKVDKNTMHQSTSTAGDKEVGGRRRRKQINRCGGPGRWEDVAQEEAEVVMQQPVRVDNKSQW